MSSERVLIVDDEPSVRLGIRTFLNVKGCVVEEAETLAQAMQTFRATRPDVAILDYSLPDGDALDLLAQLKAFDPSVPVIVLTGHGSIDLAVRAIKEGAEQFLTKPVALPALYVLLERLFVRQRAQRQQLAAGTSQNRKNAVNPFLGNSDAIQRLAQDARHIVAAESPVLISGETGTGKSLLARWLHNNGPRTDEPLVELNCAGLSRDLLETELFGHEKGAFTGAVQRKIGLVEAAHRGTLFLDEIGDVDQQVQPKLLKVLEEKQFRRVGEVRERRVDVRLIAATNQDLAQMVGERKFRSDLYFRINTLPLTIPSLRERREDIPQLADFLLAQFTADLKRGPATLSAGAKRALQSYHWPGNIRELRNVLERALLLNTQQELTERELRFDLLSAPPPIADPVDADLSLENLERRHIERVLRLEKGHVGRAATRLEVSRSSLYQKIKRYGLESLEQ